MTTAQGTAATGLPGTTPGGHRVPGVMLFAGHRRMQRAIDAYVDGQPLAPTRIAGVQAHLDRCWGCSGYAETLRLIKRALHRLAQRQPTDLAATRLRRWAADLTP